MQCIRAPATLAALLVLANPASPDPAAVDVALVFAIDGSGSIEDAEFRLQTGAIAAAITSPAVNGAIAAGRYRRIAVTYVIWGDADFAAQTGPWRLVSAALGAEAFANELQTLPRRTLGNTGLGAGLGEAVMAFGRLPMRPDRMVIDLSGDGKETLVHRRSRHGRDARRLDRPSAVALANRIGVTINGLVLTAEEPDLADWYHRFVATGPGSFVLAAPSYAEFGAAMQAKLLRELSPPAVAMN